eukprot:1347223-Pyramimonas_sp.AAC.1
MRRRRRRRRLWNQLYYTCCQCLEGDLSASLVTLGSGMVFCVSQDIADAALIREIEEPPILTQNWHT